MPLSRSSVRVKFCGITREIDALNAVALGVDGLGFVFYEPSPRYIRPDAAAAIIRKLPPLVSKVGLFVNASADFVRETVAVTGVDFVQFHGDEPAAMCRLAPRPWIKATPVRTRDDVALALREYHEAAAILLDTYDPNLYGGSGRAFDWTLLPTTTAQPIILAGGLNPGNVAEAIRRTQPYAVDVSGGIEASKGIKDYEKMKMFITEVKHVECQ